MRFLRLLVSALALAAVAHVGAGASAQTIAPGNPEWVNRPSASRRLDDKSIGLNDCQSDAKIRFDVAMSGFQTGALFEVWTGGSGCEAKESRIGASKTCELVLSQTITNTVTVEVTPRQMVKDPNISEDCTSNTPGSKTWNLYFLIVDASTSEVTQSALWPFTFDLTPPSAPLSVTASPAENALAVSFKVVENEETERVRFYCSPVDSEDGSCSSSKLPAGEAPATGTGCGAMEVLGASKGTTDSKLENYVPYAVAVAAEDKFGNVGALSEPACATPVEVTGYYEAYVAAGGQAGGGFCSFGPARRGAIPLTLGLLVGLVAVLRRRR